MNPVALTVIVPTFNQGALLTECLQSLDAQSRRPDAVIVVDDGSTEDIRGVVAAFPHAQVICLSTNCGFCKAVNTGIAAAQTSHVFLLNNDMTLDSRCIEHLITAAESNPNALVTPLILFKEQPDVIYAAGDSIRVSGRPESIGFRSQRASFTLPERIVGITGGAALIPRSAFETVGLFDERFVAYFEDADFCLRARLSGFDAALVPNAVAYHVGSASLGGKTWWRSRQCLRNHMLLVLKSFPAAFLLQHSPAILRECAHQAGMAVSSARTEFGLMRALAMAAGTVIEMILLLPHALHERKRIQRISTTPIEQIIRQDFG